MAEAIQAAAPARATAVPLATPIDNAGIVRTVRGTERLIGLVPRIILAVLVGVPVAAALYVRNWVGVGINAAVTYIVARLVIRAVNAFVLRPLQTRRYRAAAGTLVAQLSALHEPAAQWFSWYLGAPGALAITRPGHLVIADRATSYHHLWLRRDEIVGVTVERAATHITNTRHSGTTVVGRVSRSGGFVSRTTGGTSRSVTQTVERAFVEIRYRFEPNGAVFTSMVPFDLNRQGADELCAAILGMTPTR